VDEVLVKALDGPHRPDGLLMGHQSGALSAYRLLRQRGLEAGRDIAVAAFDDLEAARHMDPPCTAFAQPTYDMGEAAVEEMDRFIRGENKGGIDRAVQGELRIRASTQLFRSARAMKNL